MSTPAPESESRLKRPFIYALFALAAIAAAATLYAWLSTQVHTLTEQTKNIGTYMTNQFEAVDQRLQSTDANVALAQNMAEIVAAEGDMPEPTQSEAAKMTARERALRDMMKARKKEKFDADVRLRTVELKTEMLTTNMQSLNAQHRIMLTNVMEHEAQIESFTRRVGEFERTVDGKVQLALRDNNIAINSLSNKIASLPSKTIKAQKTPQTVEPGNIVEKSDAGMVRGTIDRTGHPVTKTGWFGQPKRQTVSYQVTLVAPNGASSGLDEKAFQAFEAKHPGLMKDLANVGSMKEKQVTKLNAELTSAFERYVAQEKIFPSGVKLVDMKATSPSANEKKSGDVVVQK